jgi:IPT/TIG domain.
VISTGANILALHPASVYAGAADGFTLKVDGSGFAASNSGNGSVLLIGGTARTTTCSGTNECIAPVTAGGVAQARNVSVQIQNSDGKKSNAVTLVVAPPNVSDEIISLSAGIPAVAGKDIVGSGAHNRGRVGPGRQRRFERGGTRSFFDGKQYLHARRKFCGASATVHRRCDCGRLSFFAKWAGRQHDLHGDRAG